MSSQRSLKLLPTNTSFTVEILLLSRALLDKKS